MARRHSRSKRTHRRRGHRGGGWGFTGPSSIPGTPGTVSNPQVYTGIGDCRAAEPGYTIPVSSYGASFKGLPGMSGGKRTRRSRKGKTRKQRGGRYGFFPEGDPNPSGQLYYAGSYAPVQRIACEGTSPNPLNPTHTGSSAPPGAANPNYWMKGGAQAVAPATYGVGNVDSMYYYAPTAGYANTASTWKDSVGAPVQIQVPFAAREMNQACLTTGGPPPLTGALQKGGKRTRKVRGGGFFNNLRARVSSFKLPFQSTPPPPTVTVNAPSVLRNKGNNSIPNSPPPPPPPPMMGGKRSRKTRGGSLFGNLLNRLTGRRSANVAPASPPVDVLAPKPNVAPVPNAVPVVPAASNAVASVEGGVPNERPLEGAVGGRSKRRHGKKRTHKRKH